MKTCSKCKNKKESGEFSLCAASHDGLQNYCKSCARAAHPCQSDPEKHRAQSLRSYYRAVKNPEFRAKARVSNRNSKRNRRHRDPASKILPGLRRRINLALRGTCKSSRTIELLGCSIDSWKAHLESLFVPGMTWENYGPVWHVDHRRPCAWFDLTDPLQQRVCFHWSNTQPLFALENLKKGARI